MHKDVLALMGHRPVVTSLLFDKLVILPRRYEPIILWVRLPTFGELLNSESLFCARERIILSAWFGHYVFEPIHHRQSPEAIPSTNPSLYSWAFFLIYRTRLLGKFRLWGPNTVSTPAIRACTLVRSEIIVMGRRPT